MIDLKGTYNLLIKITALCLVFVLASPVMVNAESVNDVMPCASYYLDAYNTYICTMGGGDIQIWYEVMGTGDMDEIGVLSIRLYESKDNSNWTWVKTYSYENYSSMLLYDDWYQFSYVPYDGVAGRYYKAYVCIWAGKNGSGDTRYMWAPSVRAT